MPVIQDGQSSVSEVANINIVDNDVSFAIPNPTIDSLVNFKTDNKIIADYSEQFLKKNLTGQGIIIKDILLQVNVTCPGHVGIYFAPMANKLSACALSEDLHSFLTHFIYRCFYLC